MHGNTFTFTSFIFYCSGQEAAEVNIGVSLPYAAYQCAALITLYGRPVRLQK